MDEVALRVRTPVGALVKIMGQASRPREWDVRPADHNRFMSTTNAVAPPPPFSAPAAEQICRVLGDAVTGSQIPNLIWPLKAPESPLDQQNTKWKRLFNAVATAQNRQQDGRPLLRLISEVMRPVRFSGPAEFEECRRLFNESLLLSGFEVADDGKLHRAHAAATLSEAQ